MEWAHSYRTNVAQKEGCEKTKRILHATFLQTSKAMCTLYAMFINHFGHKGPRPKARPLLMAAFYEFKAAVSNLY